MNQLLLDKKLSFAIVFFFMMQSLNAMVKTIFVPASLSGVYSAIFGVIIILIFSSNLWKVYKYNSQPIVLSYLLFCVIYGVAIFQSSIIRGESIHLLLSDSALWTFAFWLPIGVFSYCISDKDILYRMFYKYSFVISISMFILFAWHMLVESNESAKDYNMFLSYTLITPLLFHINKVIESKSFKLVIFCFAEFFVIVTYGSRGALLCIVAFGLLKYFYGNLSVLQKRNILFFAILGLVLFYAMFINNDLLESLGLHSRIFSKISADQATAGRDYVFEAGLALISQRPLLGYGLGGEYYAMTDMCEIIRGVFQEEDVSSLTPHNGFLEMMLCFGIPIGLAISLWILFSLKAIKIPRSHISKDLMIILYSAYIVPALTVGDGIFIKPGIAIMLYLTIFFRKYKYNYIRQ